MQFNFINAKNIDSLESYFQQVAVMHAVLKQLSISHFAAIQSGILTDEIKQSLDVIIWDLNRLQLKHSQLLKEIMKFIPNG